jgi:hypothetical protein
MMLGTTNRAEKSIQANGILGGQGSGISRLPFVTRSH